jgi:hypothetical protein
MPVEHTKQKKGTSFLIIDKKNAKRRGQRGGGGHWGIGVCIGVTSVGGGGLT